MEEESRAADNTRAPHNALQYKPKAARAEPVADLKLSGGNAVRCLSMKSRAVIDRRIHRPSSQMVHLPDCPGHIELRGRRIALRAEGAISAAAHVVVANVVFAGEGTFIVPSALM